jgi:hypothetical protein
MHKNSEFSDPVFEIARASTLVEHIPVQSLIAGDFDCSKFSSQAFKTISARSSFSEAGNGWLENIQATLVSLGTVMPPTEQFRALWVLRMLRHLKTSDGRVQYIRQQLQAVLILLCCFPSNSTLANFFQDKTCILNDIVFLLKTGPGSAEYDTSVPLDVRLLAVHCLIAVVGSRDVSGSVLGRFSWIQQELGVNRGQYMGLLPCLLRSAMSFLNVLSANAAALDQELNSQTVRDTTTGDLD